MYRSHWSPLPTKPSISHSQVTLAPLLLFDIHAPLYIVKKIAKSITSFATFFIFFAFFNNWYIERVISQKLSIPSAVRSQLNWSYFKMHYFAILGLFKCIIIPILVCFMNVILCLWLIFGRFFLFIQLKIRCEYRLTIGEIRKKRNPSLTTRALNKEKMTDLYINIRRILSFTCFLHS